MSARQRAEGDPAPCAARGYVVLCSTQRSLREHHERVARAAIAERIAVLLGYAYAGDHDASARYDAPLYFVPDDTLGIADARALGIRGATDLFGGVVPHAFVATKAITHPLVDAESAAPAGWPRDLGARLEGCVLRGYTAFTRADAREAAARLLAFGPARVKRSRGVGGTGQTRIASQAEADAAIAALDARELAEDGLVIEQNLDEPTTYSVGEVRLGALTIAYHGTQRLTRNHHGHEVYGGSRLEVVRGAFAALLGLDLDVDVRRAIELAMRYDAALSAEFPSLVASRRNYDTVQGQDRDGRLHRGVLEQSWRIGGASAAEVAALEAFSCDADLRRVRAATHETYSADDPPPGARIHFRGRDESIGGFLTKYSLIENT